MTSVADIAWEQRMCSQESDVGCLGLLGHSKRAESNVEHEASLIIWTAKNLVVYWTGGGVTGKGILGFG